MTSLDFGDDESDYESISDEDAIAELQIQQQNAAHGTIDQLARGQDPTTSTPRFGGPVAPEVEIQRTFSFNRDKWKKMNQLLSASDSGMAEISSFMDGVTEKYRAQNQSLLIKNPQSEEEALALAQQMNPVVVDPTEVANIRQLAVKLDQRMKQLDPKASFFTHPSTRKYADWMNREAGAGTAGYMVSGQQKYEDQGFVDKASRTILQGVEGTLDAGTAIVRGFEDIGRRAVSALTNDSVEYRSPESSPLNYVTDEDGKILTNQPKVSSNLTGFAMAYAWATGKNVEQYAADYNRAVEWEQAQRAGMESVVLGVSRLGGSLYGMAGPYGAAMGAGQKVAAKGAPYIQKGMQYLGALKAGNEARQLNIISKLAGVGGASAGMGAVESISYGSIDGYGSAYMHGAKMAVPIMALGWMGRRTEHYLSSRTNMPKKMAAAIGGGIEGLGFGTLEASNSDLLPSVWQFLKDPSDQTFEIYSKNIATFMLMGAMRGKAGMFADPMMGKLMEYGRFSDARAAAAEKFAKGELTQEQTGQLPIKSLDKFAELGEVSEKLKTAKQDEMGPLMERRMQLERELSAEEAEGMDQRKQVIEEGEKAISGSATEAEMEANAQIPKEIVDKIQVERDKVAAKMPEISEKIDTEVTAPKGIEVAPEAVKEVDIEGGKVEPGQLEVATPEGQPPAPEALPAEVQVSPQDQRVRDNFSMAYPPTTNKPGVPGTTPTNLVDIYREMAGRPERRGMRIPFTSIRIGGRPGDPIQTAFFSGKINRRGVAGFYNLYQNYIRTREGLDATVAAHEWAHRLTAFAHTQPGQRTFLRGRQFWTFVGRDLQQAVTRDPNVLNEGVQLLQHYGGAAQLGPSVMWAEVWAEWHARNLLSDQTLYQRYPLLTQHMTGWLSRQPDAVRNQYGRIKQMLLDFNLQGAVGRVRSEITQGVAGPLKPSQTELAIREPFLSKVFRRLTKAFVDDNVDLKMAADKWMRISGVDIGRLSILDNPTRMIDATTMLASPVVDFMVRKGIRVPGRETLGPPDPVTGARARVQGRPYSTVPLTDVFNFNNNQNTLRDFMTYLVARRQLEYTQRGLQTPNTASDYAHTVQAMEQANPDFRTRATQLKQWTDALVDYSQSLGALSPEDADRIKTRSLLYIPMFRNIEGPKKHGEGRGVAEGGSGLGTVRGGTELLADPLKALQDVALTIVSRAHQNQVMTSFYKMAMGQGAGGLAVVVPRTARGFDVDIPRILEQLQRNPDIDALVGQQLGPIADIINQGVLDGSINESTLTFFVRPLRPEGERNVILYTPRLSQAELADLQRQGAEMGALRNNNEKPVWLEIKDPKVYETLMGMNRWNPIPERLEPAFNTFFRTPRDVTRFFATAMNVTFTVRNIFRDVMAYPVFDQTGRFSPLSGLTNWIKGASLYVRNGQMRQLFQEVGAETSVYYDDMTRQRISNATPGLVGRTLQVIRGMEKVLAGPENFIRLSRFRDTYEQAKQQGRPELEARMMALESAREATVNYARAGIVSRFWNQVTPYFNAGLQGQRKTWRALSGLDGSTDAERAQRQRTAWANGIASITSLSMIHWWMTKDEEWHKDLPQWRRIGFWNFKVNDEVVSVPKPFEVGHVFGTIPEYILDKAYDNNPVDFKEIVKSTIGPIADNVYGTIIPGIMRPILEVKTNQNFYTGREITPYWTMRSKPPEEWTTFYTTETAKIMSGAIGGKLAPTEIEQVLGGYTAGFGLSAMRHVDEIFGMKDHPGSFLRYSGILGQQREHGQSRAVDDLYALSKDLEQRRDTLDWQDQSMSRRVDRAIRDISQIRERQRAGELTIQEAERQAYEVAKPIVEEQKE